MKTITVKPGDTLSAIALRELGRADAYWLIYDDNYKLFQESIQVRFAVKVFGGKPWHWIFPGMQLRVR